MSRFAKLADKPREVAARAKPSKSAPPVTTSPPSRLGCKAISGYFSPEMSLALHICARRHDQSLQSLMAEAFNDVLRKYGESPVGS